MAELADAQDLNSCAGGRAGSTLAAARLAKSGHLYVVLARQSETVGEDPDNLMSMMVRMMERNFIDDCSLKYF